MFCPSCGEEERQTSQFCRACGIDMRIVRTALEKPDAVTNSAVTARYEIGRAIAGRIKEVQTTKELRKVVEEVLPEIEKFLESPEERRLRRLRAGVITAAVGLGAALIMYLTPASRAILPLLFVGWPGGILVALIGLGIVLNGLLFSVPANQVPDNTHDARMQNLLDQSPQRSTLAQYDSSPPQYLSPPSSVTEHTTQKLPGEPVKRPDTRTTQ